MMIGIFAIYFVAQILIIFNKQKVFFIFLFINLFFITLMLYYHATSTLNIRL